MFSPPVYVALLAGVTCCCVMHLMYGRPYVEDRRRRLVHEEAAKLLKLKDQQVDAEKID